MKAARYGRSIVRIALLALCFLCPPPARAIVVFDPSNYAQNILQAIRNLQSNINEATMIANQITSLTNEARNLTRLPYNVINEFSSQFSELFSTVGEVNGLMQNLSSLQSRFEQLYPDFANTWDPVSRMSMAEDIRQRLTATREVMLGAAKTGGRVLEAMPQTQDQLETLMASSQGAVGILQATQSGNQIAGTIAGQLMTLNTQLATYSQAHMAYLMELNSSNAASKNRLDHVMDDWNESYSSRPLSENPF